MKLIANRIVNRINIACSYKQYYNNQTHYAMLIPLNNLERENLALSVIRLNNGYSVAIMSIVNGYGMDSIPSYMHNVHNDEIDAVACMENYHVITGNNLYECIDKCLAQLDD